MYSAQRQRKRGTPSVYPLSLIAYLQVRQVEVLPVVEKHDVHLVDLVGLSQGGDGRTAAPDDDGDLGERNEKGKAKYV